MRKRLMTRAPLLAMAVMAGSLWLGSAGAWGDSLVDTSGCPASGYALLGAPGGEQNQWGNEFVAPTNYLKTFAADVSLAQNQSITLALFNADAAGPSGAPIWTAPATILSTVGVFKLQTFNVDQVVTAGKTYAFVLIDGTPTTAVGWAIGSASSGACSPGPVVDGPAGGAFLAPLTSSVLLFSADFANATAPGLSPSPVSFPAQPAGTIGNVQTVTVTATGTVPATLGQVNVSGADGGDFLLVEDQCSGQTLVPSASCTIGLRFAPGASGSAARAATLDVPYLTGSTPPGGAANPPTGVTTDPLSGTAQPAGAGQVGPAGPQGPAGAAGPAGANGQVELVTCTTVTQTKKVHGHNRRVKQTRCTTKLVSGPVTFTTGGARATLTRGDVVYAVGFARGTRLQLEATRTLRPGAYVLSRRGPGVSSRERVRVR